MKHNFTLYNIAVVNMVLSKYVLTSNSTIVIEVSYLPGIYV